LPKTIAPASSEARTAGASCIGTVIGEPDRTSGGTDPLGLDRVLDRDRQTVQGPELVTARERVICRVGRRARPVGVERDHCVDLAVEPLDAVEVQLEQVPAAQLTGADGSRQLHRGTGCHVVLGHGGFSSHGVV
jgi:hypothetical protein